MVFLQYSQYSQDVGPFVSTNPWPDGPLWPPGLFQALWWQVQRGLATKMRPMVQDFIPFKGGRSTTSVVRKNSVVRLIVGLSNDCR